jgi:hypothetical protein
MRSTDAMQSRPTQTLPIPNPPNPYPLNKHPSTEEDAVLVDGHDLAGGEAALG